MCMVCYYMPKTSSKYSAQNTFRVILGIYLVEVHIEIFMEVFMWVYTITVASFCGDQEVDK